MKIAVFSTKPYDRRFLEAANLAVPAPHRLIFHEARLDACSAVAASDAEGVCPFVNDQVDARVLRILRGNGTRLICLRCAGYNNVDVKTAHALQMAVARVPAYSPHAVAEHTLAILLSLIRRIHRAYARVREGNFALDGLLGFDLHGRTVGVIGTGNIGLIVSQILAGFGCEVLGTDPVENDHFPGSYVALNDLLARSDIISLHCPLNPETRHMIDAGAIARMKDGITIINTSRGAVIDTRAIIMGLKSGKIGQLGLDVYEEASGIFFEDLSDQPIVDDTLARLLTFPNVLITGHQGFFTADALRAIAATTIANATAFETQGAPLHPVGISQVTPG
ncbi:2-hydroxyacid dehydrogenase [Altererythrobacter aquiaggeris]|uniref:2-hydroxyacid dehydrogenase n=1 Tax=Aestuarierythrobacter aquiaggeris TaxID=1898396 RepID=UPI0030173434